jgi:hypothetical protein
MSFYVDAKEALVVASNLGKIAGSALQEVDAIIKRGAQNVKNEMATDARGSQHFRGMAGSISYDSDYRIGEAAYEVGPDKSRPGGSLGNIYYFGTSRGGGTGDLEKPLRSEEPRLVNALNDLAGKFGSRL